MNKFAFVAPVAVLVLLSPLGLAQDNQNGGNAPGDFVIERILRPTGILSPSAPNLPPDVLAGFLNGSLEIHQLFKYDSAQRTLDQIGFIVPGKSPLPFPTPVPAVDHYVIHVDTASITSQPGASIVMTGRVISNDAPTPFGDITGAIVTLSFGYQGAGAQTRFGPIYEAVSPLYGLYTDTGVGMLSLTPAAQANACSTATLSGAYMFQIQGSVQSSATGAYTPFVDSGRFVADGNGTLSVVDSGNLVGKNFTDRAFPITYTIDQNCSGTLTLPGGATMGLVVSKDGERMNMVFTSPSSTPAMGTGRRQ